MCHSGGAIRLQMPAGVDQPFPAGLDETSTVLMPQFGLVAGFATPSMACVVGGHTLNAWLVPLGRNQPPRVSPAEEIVQLKHDLDALELDYDADGINPDVHPEIANAFKAAFGLGD